MGSSIDAMDALFYLVMFYTRWNPEKGADIGKKLTDISEQTVGMRHPLTSRCYKITARCLYEVNDFVGARTYCEQALKATCEGDGTSVYIEYGSICNLLGQIIMDSHQGPMTCDLAELAVKHLTKGVAAVERYCGSDSPNLVPCMSYLACAEAQTKNYSSATSTAQRAIGLCTVEGVND